MGLWLTEDPKEFGPNVTYCFLGFNENELKHKFHGLVGPPAEIFEKTITCETNKKSFEFQERL